MTFVGYKLLKPALILTGVAATGIPAFLFAWNYAPDSSTFSLTAASLSGVFGGVLGGVLCWRLFKVGVFIMGASLGVIVAMLLHILVFARFLSAYGNTPLIVAAVLLGLGLGALGLRFMRKTMVVATSTLGAYAAIRGVSLFVPGSFLSELTLARRIQAGETLPQAMDGYLGGIAALALAGMLVQFLVTARKVGKDDAKDELEEELEESELSLEALQGACVCVCVCVCGAALAERPSSSLSHSAHLSPPCLFSHACTRAQHARMHHCRQEEEAGQQEKKGGQGEQGSLAEE
jgi:hypothetical protein